MPGSVVIAGARTPIGKLSGGLASLSAVDLGGIAIRAALERSGVSPEAVDYVFMGNVLSAGLGQGPARQAAVKAGIPMSVPSTTLNKLCLSGINSIYLADLLISAGDAEIVVAGGMESMTNAPYLLTGVRAGLRMGDGVVVDSMMYDGLSCAFDRCSMGLSTDRDSRGRVNREAQDEMAARSHERAAAAIKEGRLADEIVPVSIPQRKGDPIVIDTDEGVRPGTTVESLSTLRPAFDKDGSITAGNSSQISDGGAAVVIASKAKAEAMGLTPQAEILSYGQVAGPGTSLLNQPSQAILRALGKLGRRPSDMELIEINEAFASVGIASMEELGVDDSVVNVNGGAIALGHPIGMSGTRVVLTLIHELRRRGGGVGTAALCGGGGQGDAIIVQTL